MPANSPCASTVRSRPLELTCDRSGRPKQMRDRRCPIGAMREILGPIAGAAHLVHGPIGCSLSSQCGDYARDFDIPLAQFSTSLAESDIIFGGERKLDGALDELIETRAPRVVFVYATCVASLIGDDIEAVSARASRKFGIPVVFVDCKGYKPSNHIRLAAPCEALLKLVEPPSADSRASRRINILGLYRGASVIEGYFKRMGIEQAVSITGSADADSLRTATSASLDLVLRSRPMALYSRMLWERYGVPLIDVSFLGVDATADSLRRTARFFGDAAMVAAAERVIEDETARIRHRLEASKRRLDRVRAVVNPGGPYSTAALCQAIRSLGIEIAALNLRAVQDPERARIQDLGLQGCLFLEDATSAELANAAFKTGADIVIGEVADGLVCRLDGMPFCLHNRHALARRQGFAGMAQFASDIEAALFSRASLLARTEL